MKKVLNLLAAFLIVLVSLASQSWAGEASFFDQNIGKIIRVYDESPGGLFIEVRSTSNHVDSAFNVNCGGSSGNNPLNITPLVPSDLSLAYDPGTKKAYVFYQTSTLQFAACTISSSSVTTYTISGTVQTSSGSPINSVQMALNTGANVSTGTDGSYTFSGLSNNTYTVTPAKSNYTFSPPSQQVTISGANVSNVNFTGTETSVSGADLVPARVGAPNGMRNGYYFDVVVDVKNIGSAPVVTTFMVSAYISGSSTWSDRLKAICSNTIAGLPAGQQVQVTLKDCYFNDQAIHRYSTLFVMVDSAKQVAETNETNNLAKASVYIFSLD